MYFKLYYFTLCSYIRVFVTFLAYYTLMLLLARFNLYLLFGMINDLI